MTPMAPRLIAIGASLGGLDALQLLLRALPATFACPIVIVQHRRPEVDGRLIELLNSRSTLPVVEPDDKQVIQPGHVYLAPPNYHLIVEDGFFSLSIDAPVLFARPSIDVLFESVADSYGAGGLAVMLTSSNDDGALGAQAVKSAGGRVLVQDPASAKAPEGPRSVLAVVVAERVLPLELIADYLVELCQSPT